MLVITESARLQPSACAVVIVDVQNDFCHPVGLQGSRGQDLSAVDPAVDRTMALVSSAHEHSIPVIYIQTTHGPESDTEEWLSRRNKAPGQQNCPPGEWGSEFYRVEPQSHDFVVEKHRYSAFTNPKLVSLLDELNRRSLVICGVTTNTCVESTLRDAVSRDYLATLVDDCSAAYGLEAHNRAIAATEADFGLVTSQAHLVAAWAAGTNDQYSSRS